MLTGVLTRIVKRRVAFLIVGLMAVVLGVILVSASTVTCGNDTMREGDVCLITGEDEARRAAELLEAQGYGVLVSPVLGEQ